jgi:hypothetical protein
MNHVFNGGVMTQAHTISVVSSDGVRKIHATVHCAIVPAGIEDAEAASSSRMWSAGAAAPEGGASATI